MPWIHPGQLRTLAAMKNTAPYKTYITVPKMSLKVWYGISDIFEDFTNYEVLMKVIP